MTTTTRTQDEITEAVRDFLDSWDRGEWQAENGSWASAEWDDAREEYSEALAALREAVAELPDAERADSDSPDGVRTALKRLQLAADELQGQVLPENDFIAPGVIDPDDVAAECDDFRPLASASWDAWDCRGGWHAHRVGDDLYLNWFRLQCRGARIERDLYVLVESNFFADE